MLRSMTAFASRTGRHLGQTWAWDMRSVNGRGFDLRLRLPDLAGLEQALRGTLKGQIARGTVTLGLRMAADGAQSELNLDEAQLTKVLRALDTIESKAGEIGVTLAQPTAADVLTTKGVLSQGDDMSEDETTALRDALLADFAEVLADFQAARESEGAAIKAVLTGQVDQIADLTAAAQKVAEARPTRLSDTLERALARLGDEVTHDPDRLAQELALLLVKADITEELDRLRAHVDQARGLLAQEGPVGRKLDFLAQEFNREANTLCSKSGDTELTQIGLDLKVAIDQMREQVQNLE